MKLPDDLIGPSMQMQITYERTKKKVQIMLAASSTCGAPSMHTETLTYQVDAKREDQN